MEILSFSPLSVIILPSQAVDPDTQKHTEWIEIQRSQITSHEHLNSLK